MSVPLLFVDAFTANAFAGNPAAVVILTSPGDARWMQAVAAEVCMSETAFPVPRADGRFDLRWFTPTSEIDLCGHATLATAHVLWERGIVAAARTIEFETASGRLRVSPGEEGWIEMDFPIWRFEPVSAGGTPAAAEDAARDASGGAARTTVANALVQARELGRALCVEPRGVWRRADDWLVLVDDPAAVRAAAPDFETVAAIGRMVIVTAPAAPGLGVDFVSRTFVPRQGIPEDPVTGSAHCALAPFWAARLGREELVGYQASRRGGTVRVRVAGERVAIRGQAVTVFRGELAV